MDVSHAYSVANEERLCNAVMRVPKSNGTREFVDVHWSLPEDLCAALAELAPVDKDSGANLAAWLCRETAKLCCFEQHQAISSFVWLAMLWMVWVFLG